MPKLKLLILDAGVVIRLHELGVWKQVRDRCDIFLSRIVAEKEVLFQPGDEGEYGQDIDLSSDINIGKISVFDVAASELKVFRDQFDSLYLGDLDDGGVAPGRPGPEAGLAILRGVSKEVHEGR